MSLNWAETVCKYKCSKRLHVPYFAAADQQSVSVSTDSGPAQSVDYSPPPPPFHGELIWNSNTDMWNTDSNSYGLTALHRALLLPGLNRPASGATQPCTDLTLTTPALVYRITCNKGDRTTDSFYPEIFNLILSCSYMHAIKTQTFRMRVETNTQGGLKTDLCVKLTLTLIQISNAMLRVFRSLCGTVWHVCIHVLDDIQR